MEDNRFLPKISGYLEKKGKKKLITCYKKYWFVLEGRLLLYYRSKDEYDAISPCKGSINLGPPCTVKPCTSSLGVFQIETRSTTITLRAENMEEQNKWMQAVMSALNQNSNATKLCHFRYSLGELPQSEERKPSFLRQNTLPRRPITNESGTLTKDVMLDKLQKFGAYKYIGSSENEHSSTKRLSKKKSHSEESLPISRDNRNRSNRSSIMEENPEYIVAEPKKVCSVESVQSSEDLYERIPSNESVFLKCDPDIPVRKKESVQSYLRENSIYSTVNTTDSTCRDSKAIYSEPILEGTNVPEILDCNENVDYIALDSPGSPNGNCVEMENVDYMALDSPESPTSNYNKCSDSSASESPTTIVNKNENQYHYIENPLYSEPEYNRCSSSSDTSNNAVCCIHLAKKPSSCRFKNFTKRLTSGVNQKIKENTKLTASEDNIKQPIINRKKSKSFMRRVWNKGKLKKKESIEESVYEEPPRLTIENDNKTETITDDNAVQILSEMKNLLEKTLPTLQKHISSSESSEQTQFENKNSISEEGEDTVFSSSSENVCPLLPPRIPRSRIKSPYHDTPKNKNPISIVPPKMKKNLDKITIEDILNQLETQPPQKTKNTTETDSENITKDTAEIEHETIESMDGGKVKQLIKKFSEEEEVVEVRQKIRQKTIQENDIEQDELSRLLDELAKVTSAPLMTPGATSSLITGTISDDEWLKLIPIRCRRASDPDYDIPRPHRSLPNLPKREENALTATRFFGSILNPADIENINKHKTSPGPTKPADEDSTVSLSITPDSLEPDLHQSYLSSKATTEVSHCEEDRNNSYHSREANRNLSYNSHDYLERSNNKQNLPPQNIHVCQRKEDKNEFFIENCLYACPKTLNALNQNNNNVNEHHQNMGSTKTSLNSDDEVDAFVDSLEVYAEIGTTAF